MLLSQSTVNINSMHYTNSQAFSMGGAGRTDFTASPTKEYPGPGAYSSTFFGKEASPKWNLATTGQREFIKINTTPGPGKYDVKAIDNAPKISLSGWTPVQDVKNTPAPNAYNCKFPNKPSISSRSFGYKAEIIFGDKEVPGPGKYYQEPSLVAPTAKISKGEKAMNKKSPREMDVSPGPGRYDVPNLSVTTSTKFSKGGREYLRAIERSSVSPGPGKYDLPGSFKTSKDNGFTIKGKRKDPLPDNIQVPGPGSYPAQHTLDKKSFSVGKSFRRPLNDMDKSIPGPGTYEPQTSSTIPNWKFGSSQRSELVKSENPGPGSYFETKPEEAPTVDAPDRGKSNTIDVVHKDNTPGPGAYRPSYDHVWNKNPTFKQGLGVRDPPNEKRNFPGPGQYSTIGEQMNGPRYTFGVGLNKHTIRKALFEPGPGSYDLPHTIGAVPKYLLPNGPTKIHF